MYKIGDRVVFIDAEAHEKRPEWYPPVGTIGIILDIDCRGGYLIKWAKHSTSSDVIWVASPLIHKLKKEKLGKSANLTEHTENISK